MAEAEAEAAGQRGAGAEAERRRRSQEAKRLIGASTAAARAVFQQNLAQGQISRCLPSPTAPYPLQPL